MEHIGTKELVTEKLILRKLIESDIVYVFKIGLMMVKYQII